MIQHRDGAPRIEFSIPIEVAQQFLFLRVDADHRPTRRQVLLLEIGNPLELPMTIGMLLEGLFLLGLTANYAATAWKTWQWVIGGTYGAVMLNAFFGLLAAEQKTQDHTYEQPLWERGMTTGLVGIALLVNMVAAYRIISASAKPVSNTLKLQMLAGTSGSGADGTYLNWKLKVRDNLRTEIGNGGFPYVGLKHKQGGHYIFTAVKASFPGMFAINQESRHASAARSAYEKLLTTRDELSKLELEARAQPASNLVDFPEHIEIDATSTDKENAPAKVVDIDDTHYIAMRDADE